MELNELRQQIDEIDRKLVSLFIERMSCSAEIAEYKQQHGLPVLDAEREQALLNKISVLSGNEFEEYARVIYNSILSTSKSYQQKILDRNAESKNTSEADK